MWQRALLAKLRAEQPRWRWSSTLTYHGGTLHGRHQKSALKVELQYRRCLWRALIYVQMGRAKEWVMTLDVASGNPEYVTESILGECMKAGGHR